MSIHPIQDQKGDLMLYVVGDSHQHAFENNSFFTLRGIGAATAYHLKDKVSTNNSNKKLLEIVNSIDKEKDTIILNVGEIDCRIHIYYQAQKRGDDLCDIIDETVYRYGLALNWILKQDVPILFVLGIPPPGTYDRFEYDTPGKPYASPNLLSYIYREFNQKMKAWCEERLTFYLDIYSQTVDEKGFLKKEYAADAVHLNSKALPLIKKKIEWVFENLKSGDFDTEMP